MLVVHHHNFTLLWQTELPVFRGLPTRAKASPDFFVTPQQQLNAEGLYAGVYLFSGEWLLRFRFPGDGYPLSGSNNVNGIDDGGGVKSVTMSASNAITDIQDAFVRKLIDALNDLPNVLWIVSRKLRPVQNGGIIICLTSHAPTKPRNRCNIPSALACWRTTMMPRS